MNKINWIAINESYPIIYKKYRLFMVKNGYKEFNLDSFIHFLSANKFRCSLGYSQAQGGYAYQVKSTRYGSYLFTQANTYQEMIEGFIKDSFALLEREATREAPK